MFEVLGLILSIVGVLAIIPQVFSFVSSYLPEYKLNQLDATLKDAAALLEWAIQDGLIQDSSFVKVTQRSLHRFRERTESLRASVLSASGFYKQFHAAFIGGLSTKIDRTCREVKDVRARIVTTSDEARQKSQPRISEEPNVAADISPLSQSIADAPRRRNGFEIFRFSESSLPSFSSLVTPTATPGSCLTGNLSIGPSRHESPPVLPFTHADCAILYPASSSFVSSPVSPPPQPFATSPRSTVSEAISPESHRKAPLSDRDALLLGLKLIVRIQQWMEEAGNIQSAKIALEGLLERSTAQAMAPPPADIESGM
ncbi:hypothetical protein BXZ70DRAFT_926316 [Cristinia sonorae]|uniref:Uncharacterized protein n=1 Tax=Cristinia sonorae TaxID=1940300 RepID=A0A8K0XSI9_9AGAR|nr:hypothetical protein BXZ70DRAFT_926316 [Cristinia sonorae]